MKNADIASKITTESVATAPQGSWKWPNAYRATDYRARLADNGKVLWEARASTGKLSMPQIRRNGYGHLPIGGLHNQPVPRQTAIQQKGYPAVKRIESHGWRFGE